LSSGGVSISNEVRTLFGFYGSEIRKTQQKKNEHTQPEWGDPQVLMLAASKLNKGYRMTDKE
jgi:hypothetical protein